MDLSIQFFLDGIESCGHVNREPRSDEPGAMLRDYLVEHYERLHRRLANHVGSSDLASDCLHDAWLRLVDMALPASVRQPEAYLYRILRNLAMDHLRSAQHTVSFGEPTDDIDMPDLAPGPDEIAGARSTLGALDRALRGLPDRHRQILFELRVSERSRGEVAATYGVSMRTVDTILRRTLAHCALQMNADRNGCRENQAARETVRERCG